jgi:nucleoside-diphosphate kinase
MCFIVDYFDSVAGIVRQYQLLYFYDGNTVEMTDIKTKRLFLKRCVCSTLKQSMFYMGARVVIFGRVLKIVGYGDEVTKQLCEAQGESTVVVVHADGVRNIGTILQVIQIECRYSVREMKLVEALPNDHVKLQKIGVPATFFPQERTNLLAFELVRENAVRKGADLVARFPRVMWACADKEQVEALESALLPLPKTVAHTEDCCIIMVKPHAIESGAGGEILSTITKSGLTISAVAQATLTSGEADSFMNSYKGVLAEYHDAVHHMASGATWVLQVTGADAVLHSRELCGPFDPVIARALRPNTIRAKYGKDRVLNAVHVTDLPEYGVADAHYFFGLK